MIKFSCGKTILNEAINSCLYAVSLKSTIPALEGLLISAAGESLTITGYDLSMGITTSIPANVINGGSIVIKAKLISDIVRKLSGETVNFEADDKLLVNIVCGISEFTIMGIPHDEFPELPSLGDVKAISINGNVLKSMIDQTQYAVAATDANAIYLGSLFKLKGGVLSLVSVDGYRLAIRNEPLAGMEDCEFIVPGKTLSEIAKLIKPDGKGDVAVKFSENHALFLIDGYNVITRLLVGKFLDYEKSIPTDIIATAVVSTRKLAESIERASLLITEKIKSPLKLVFEDNLIKISCSTVVGKAYDETECRLSGNRIEIGFNHRYLIEALKNCDTDEILLELKSSVAPLKITAAKDSNFIFAVLPVRLAGG